MAYALELAGLFSFIVEFHELAQASNLFREPRHGEPELIVKGSSGDVVR
jgi:hypothetical protein